MQSLTFSLLKKFLLKVQSSTLTFYSQEYPQKMHMTHCPVRVRDLSRITFYKNFVPFSNVHSPLILIKTKRSPFLTSKFIIYLNSKWPFIDQEHKKCV